MKKPSGALHPIPVQPRLWHQIGMDLIGPLTETSRNNKFIITVTDYFSKWAEAGPLPSKHAYGVARFLYSTVKLTYFTVTYCKSIVDYNFKLYCFTCHFVINIFDL